MAFYKVLMVAFASVLLLEKTTKMDACSCVPGFDDLCVYVKDADVVLHGRAVNRSEQVEMFGDVNYTIGAITIYKGETNTSYAQEIQITTAGSSGLCGVVLEIGEEYLLGLDRDNGGLETGSCNLVAVWTSVDDDGKAALESGCVDDPCDCGESQECLLNEGNSNWYSSDTCDNNPCATDEQCTTRARRWCRNSGEAGCPRKRKCF